MHVNARQRKLLLIAAAAVGVLLLLEVDAKGLADSHWIVVMPIIVGLLFVAFSSKPVTSATPPAIPKAALTANWNKGDEGDAVVHKRFTACVGQWQRFMASSFVDRKPKASARERADMEPSMHMAACKMAFANYLLIILHRCPEAAKSEDAIMLRKCAASTLANRLKQSLEHVQKALSGLPPITREDYLDMAVEQLVEYELILRKCQQSLATQKPFPLDALYTKIDNDAKFNLVNPTDRDSFFGIKFREEIGRLLHPTAGITA